MEVNIMLIAFSHVMSGLKSGNDGMDMAHSPLQKNLRYMAWLAKKNVFLYIMLTDYALLHKKIPR
jgi:hypothetical protein